MTYFLPNWPCRYGSVANIFPFDSRKDKEVKVGRNYRECPPCSEPIEILHVSTTPPPPSFCFLHGMPSEYGLPLRNVYCLAFGRGHFSSQLRSNEPSAANPRSRGLGIATPRGNITSTIEALGILNSGLGIDFSSQGLSGGAVTENEKNDADICE